jgi:hypothetical protein
MVGPVCGNFSGAGVVKGILCAFGVAINQGKRKGKFPVSIGYGSRVGFVCFCSALCLGSFNLGKPAGFDLLGQVITGCLAAFNLCNLLGRERFP